MGLRLKIGPPPRGETAGSVGAAVGDHYPGYDLPRDSQNSHGQALSLRTDHPTGPFAITPILVPASGHGGKGLHLQDGMDLVSLTT